MNQPAKEQIQWFWEQCGWKYKPDELCGDPRSPHIKHSYGWLAPDDYQWKPDAPPIDLNNLFKYAVPQLDGYMMFTSGGIHFIASKDGLNYEVIAEKEEDAAFGAIYMALEVTDEKD